MEGGDNAEFKKSYRRSTMNCYLSLRGKFKTMRRVGNKMHYHLALVTLTHVWNHMMMGC